MELNLDTLPSMANFGQFTDVYYRFAKVSFRKALLAPRFSLYRMQDAYHAWTKDLERVTAREDHIETELDHFKQSAHLSYWLRRCAPVVEFENLSELYEEGGLYQDEAALQDLLYKYGTEYLPFDFGLQICQYYEAERTDRESVFVERELTTSFINDVCHMMKFKHVSPHSLYLIYRSICL